MKNWKTTLFGALAAACSAVATQDVSPTVKTVAGLLASVFTGLLGYHAADGGKEVGK